MGNQEESRGLTFTIQDADPSTSKSTPAHHAVTLLLRSDNVRSFKPTKMPAWNINGTGGWGIWANTIS